MDEILKEKSFNVIIVMKKELSCVSTPLKCSPKQVQASIRLF